MVKSRETISEKFEINTPCVLCNICALAYNGLVTHSADHYDFMTRFKDLDGLNLVYLTYYYYETINDMYALNPDVNDPNILVPTKERALIEYMKNEKWCDEGVLIEALKSYLMWFRNDEELYKVANYFGVEKHTVDYWINEALIDEEVQ